jgi:hypothetical protein
MALTPMYLRLESLDGCTEEYRIWEGEVEVREQHPVEEERGWHRLTPEELTSHVNRNTVVAQWLMRRLGWRRLLRACVADHNLYFVKEAQSASDHSAALMGSG